MSRLLLLAIIIKLTYEYRTKMRIFTRIVIITALTWLVWVLFQDVRGLQTIDDNGVPIADAQMKVMLYFGVVILLVVGIGVIIALSLIPAIGDRIGAFFYNPGEQIEKDPHADAMACMAQGDYGGAIKEYFKACDANQMDTHALSEIAHIYCDKLQDSAAAGATLEEALKREWPDEESVFLRNRLVDVYWNYQRDAIRARELLIQIAENLPETRYAANAQHRLLEMDRALNSEYSMEIPGGQPPSESQQGA